MAVVIDTPWWSDPRCPESHDDFYEEECEHQGCENCRFCEGTKCEFWDEVDYKYFDGYCDHYEAVKIIKTKGA